MKLYDSKHLVEYIYSSYSQIELFSFYLGISTNAITWCLHKKSNKIRNPLRPSDDVPSLGFLFFKVKDSDTIKRLRMKDWGDSYFNFDIFDLVGHIINKNPRNSEEFISICDHIINTFNRDKLDFAQDERFYSTYAGNINGITVFVREFNKQDINYWSRFYISDFKQERIYAVETAFMNEKCIYNYRVNDPCYGYLDSVADDVQYWTLYFPKRKKKDKHPRFITNINYTIKDASFLRKTPYLIITKAKKEAALFRAFQNHPLYTIGVSLKDMFSICYMSESEVIAEDLAQVLLQEYDKVFINSDGDRQGVKCARAHMKYGFIPLIFSNGFLGTFNYKAKDLGDYNYRYGVANTFLLILEVLKILNIYDASSYISPDGERIRF